MLGFGDPGIDLRRLEELRRHVVEELCSSRYAAQADDVAQEFVLRVLEGSITGATMAHDQFRELIFRMARNESIGTLARLARAGWICPRSLKRNTRTRTHSCISVDQDEEPTGDLPELDQLEVAFSPEDLDLMLDQIRRGNSSKPELARACGIRVRGFRYRANKVKRTHATR